MLWEAMAWRGAHLHGDLTPPHEFESPATRPATRINFTQHLTRTRLSIHQERNNQLPDVRKPIMSNLLKHPMIASSRICCILIRLMSLREKNEEARRGVVDGSFCEALQEELMHYVEAAPPLNERRCISTSNRCGDFLEIAFQSVRQSRKVISTNFRHAQPVRGRRSIPAFAYAFIEAILDKKSAISLCSK